MIFWSNEVAKLKYIYKVEADAYIGHGGITFKLNVYFHLILDLCVTFLMSVVTVGAVGAKI